MKIGGIILLCIGVAVAIGSLFLPVTVETFVPGPYGVGSSSVVNLSKLQTQALVFEAGCTLFLAGIALSIGGAIMGRLARSVVSDASSAAPAEAMAAGRSLAPTEPVTEEAKAAQDRVMYWCLGGIAAIVLITFAVAFS